MCCPFPPVAVRTQISAAKRTASTQMSGTRHNIRSGKNHNNHTKFSDTRREKK